MQITIGGPDLPPEILQALEDGSLAIFCGAGLSIGTGLPSFAGLVTQVYRELGATPTDVEQLEIQQENFDRALGLLESVGRFKREQVRQAVARILSLPYSGVPPLHKAILDLASSPATPPTLVTTNFDNRFDLVDPSTTLAAYTAPALPVPKRRRWRGIVYLHGRLTDQDPAGDDLVLTAADFGVAYLSEAWAARFVTELFTHHTVLFVGYSANDRVMRYLIDALALERHRGGRLTEAYALASASPLETDRAQREWNARNIRPILYNPIDDHRILTETLVEWARIHRGGLISKQSLATTIGRSDPKLLSAEELSQISWALSERSGAVAREFANLGLAAPLSWLPVLERAGLLDGEQQQSHGRVPLVGQSATKAIDPTPIAKELGRWIVCHLGDKDVLSWVLKNHCHMHPTFQALVRSRLASKPEILSSLASIWRALLGDDVCPRSAARDFWDLAPRVRSEPWTPELRHALLTALKPQIRLREALRIFRGPLDPTTAPSISDLVSVDCELQAGHALEPIIAAIKGRSDIAEVMADLAYNLTSLLRTALDLQAMLGVADADYDRSVVERPAIGTHEQNTAEIDSWATLIELTRDSFDHLLALDAERAKQLLAVWSAQPFPVFRRLYMHAVTG